MVPVPSVLVAGRLLCDAQTSAHGSTIRSNGDVAIVAREGDLTITGSRVEGENVGLAAKRDILLQSAKETSEQRERSKSSSGEVGFTMGSEAGFGIYLSASASRGRGDGSSVHHKETVIQGKQGVSFVSGGNTTLEGAQIIGERVVGQVGGNLTIRSQQDSEQYQRKDQSAGFDAAFGTGGGSFSANYSQSKINSNYTSVREQSGIQAGAGGFQLDVKGHTQLDGGAIASTATADRNVLSTGSLAYTDLHNHAEYKAESFSASGGTSGGGTSPGGGKNPWSGGLSPGLPVSQQDSISSTTRAGIAEGTLIVADGSGTGIARGVTELQQDGLKTLFDEQKVRERLEMGQVAGEVGFRAAGDLAGRMGWKEGSKEKAILHGAVGAAVAALGGGNALEGLKGAAANQLVHKTVSKYLIAQGYEEGSGVYNTLMQLASLATDAAVGGNTGASIALQATQHNYLTHQQQELLKERLAACGGADNPQACKENAVSEAMTWSQANDEAMKLACAGSRESDVCTAKVKEARDYANNTGFAREVASHLDGRTDTNLLNVLGYDQWNSGDLARTSELENDPVLYGFNLVSCFALSLVGGTCSSPPPPGSGQVEAVSIPGLEYGAGLVRLGGKKAADVADDIFRKTDGNLNWVDDALPKPSTRAMTEAEARRLGGENRGLIYVLEKPRGHQAAQDFQSGTSGAFSDVASQKSGVPALRYDNPNANGVNYIKFDGVEQAVDGTKVLLIDAKTKLATWSSATQEEVRRTLRRVESALKQNPGYKVVYEFPNARVEAAAKQFIKDNELSHVVLTRVRK